VTGVQVVPTDPLKAARKAAKELGETSGRRDEIPVRNSFVRSADPDQSPPLARLVSTRGRGGAVPVLLYLALIWRCSAAPFKTDLQARKWAVLLGLANPDTHGARRVANALDVLERERLVQLERRRGESTIITVLMESGNGSDYQLPSTATARARTKTAAERHRYFKIPPKLWITGEIQSMSAGALAMLLILLCERNVDGRATWWSTERFPELFSISPSMRSKGTKELEDRGLLLVTKQRVADGADPTRVFTRERVRNLYRLTGDARPQAMREAQASRKRAVRKRAIRRPSR
jgi:hypothetical protein